MQIISFFFAAVFYIYILFSRTADRYYVGHTPDVQKRLEEHNNPSRPDKYTAKYLPWELAVYFPVSGSRGEAIMIERFIKKQKSRNFIADIILNINDNNFIQSLIKKVLNGKLFRAIPRTRD
jgi:putative endonuclease